MSTLKKPHVTKLLIAVAVLGMGLPVFGQQFVDAPEPKLVSAAAIQPVFIRPKPAPTHQFLDRQNVIAFSAAAALRAADSAYTCAVGVGSTTHNADGSITVHHEDLMPVNSCHGVVLMNAAFAGMGLSGSYLLHKMGWHKLERVPNWIVASVPVLGIAYTATHQNMRAASLPGR